MLAFVLQLTFYKELQIKLGRLRNCFTVTRQVCLDEQKLVLNLSYISAHTYVKVFKF